MELKLSDKGYTLEFYTLVWTDVTGTNVAPDTDTAINVKNAKSITIQYDSTNPNNTATDIDMNVLFSVDDGATYDSGESPTVSVNFGDNVISSFMVEPGATHIKLRLDENGSLNAYVTARIVVRK